MKSTKGLDCWVCEAAHVCCTVCVSPSSNEDAEEGYVLDQDGIGLRLAAMEYWKCSETGIGLPFKDGKEPDCKFVIAESLPEQCATSRFIKNDHMT